MRSTLILFLLTSIPTLGCQAPTSLGNDQKPIVRQRAIADIACGPSAVFNWMSHGGKDLQGILTSLSTDKTPVQTVQHIIDTYGKRQSAMNPSVMRYGPHNGGGSIQSDVDGERTAGRSPELATDSAGRVSPPHGR